MKPLALLPTDVEFVLNPQKLTPHLFFYKPVTQVQINFQRVHFKFKLSLHLKIM